MKSYSIRKKLSIKLSSIIGITIVLTGFISFLFTSHEVKELFDANLVKSTKLILGLIKHEITEEQDQYFMIDPELINSDQKSHRYEYKLHSQAWNNGHLVYNSDETFKIDEPSQTGFSDIEIDNKKWRVFTFIDKENLIKISVLEQYEIRRELIFEILSSLILPFLLCIILITIIIFKIINQGLKPFGSMANKIERMSSETLERFEQSDIPKEIIPFVNSFNDLISKLKNSLESERRFTDYAAHELQTPLATIKTQTQLLQKNKNPQKQSEFLQDLIQGVNRASDMVEKLLILARLEPEKNDFVKEEVNLSNCAKLSIENYKKYFAEKNIKLTSYFDNNSIILGNKTYIEILFNNIIDNAIKYSPDNSEIDIVIDQNIITIKNQGYLISKEDENLIFDNFYRAKNRKSVIGSGLGLAICKKITDLHHGTIAYLRDNNLNVIKITF